MSNTTTGTKVNVPEAREAMNRFKYEVANEIGVPLKQGYNGDLTSAQNGYVGGYMVNIILTKNRKNFKRNIGYVNGKINTIKYKYKTLLTK